MRLPLPSPGYDPVPPGEDLFHKQQDITHPWVDHHIKKVLSESGITITQKLVKYFKKLLIGALLATTALSNAYAMQPSFDPSILPGYQMVQVEKPPQYPPGPAGGITQYPHQSERYRPPPAERQPIIQEQQQQPTPEWRTTKPELDYNQRRDAEFKRGLEEKMARQLEKERLREERLTPEQREILKQYEQDVLKYREQLEKRYHLRPGQLGPAGGGSIFDKDWMTGPAQQSGPVVQQQPQQQMQRWLGYELYPLQPTYRMSWNGNPVDPGYFTFDWYVDTPEVQQFLDQEKIHIKEITDAVEKGRLDANTQQYVQGAGKEAAIKAWILRDVHEFINKLIRGAPQKNWRSPQEIFKMKEGDCKSYVIAKMAMLKALGFEDEDIILIIGITQANRFEEKFGELPTDAGHIVMGVNIHSQDKDPSDSWTFLDDLQDELGIDWGLYGFPMYLINNHGVWNMLRHVEVPPPSIPGHTRKEDTDRRATSDTNTLSQETDQSAQDAKSHNAASASNAGSIRSSAFDSIDELSKTDQVFVQAEVLLRPGISDLPDVSVREFLERILRAPMDNGQLPRLVQIVKRDNEYTVDIQMKNRVALLFRHVLSPPANGRAAMLQSVIFTVTFSRGQKVDPPYEYAMDPSDFAAFMSAVPGFTTTGPGAAPQSGGVEITSGGASFKEGRYGAASGRSGPWPPQGDPWNRDWVTKPSTAPPPPPQPITKTPK